MAFVRISSVLIGVCLYSAFLASIENQQVLADLSGRLRTYETVHPSDIVGASHRYKRSTHGPEHKRQPIVKLSVTTSAGRILKLSLTEDRDVFGPGFRVTIVRDNGKEEPVKFNQHVHYKGIVEGEYKSQVFLHWETDDAFSAKIITQSDTFYIEPSSPHLPNSENYTMIAYSASELIPADEPRSHCGGVSRGATVPEEEVKYMAGSHHTAKNLTLPTDSEKSRTKRQSASSPINTCGLLVVIDTKFLTEIMDGDVDRATNYVVDLIGRVNAIYRKTKFGDNEGFGFQIEQIKIHDTYSSDPLHYNYKDRNIDITEPNPVNVLLDAFGRVDKTGNTDYTGFCLAHLFTAYAFKNGVLGLAYIASPSRSTYGGICSKSYYDSSLKAQIYLNTGWSSALNKNGQKILTQEAEVVLAHELGHNFGSEHDPDTTSCAPSTFNGGKYIMFTYSVDGNDANNNRFSECSRSSIAQVLNSKSSQCFKETTSPTRGNYNRDEGEECDAGVGGDACCGPDFKYTPGSTCSPTNDNCCTNCQIGLARGKLCASDSDFTCLDESTCDGVSASCPETYKPTGSTCQQEYGRCLVRNDRTKCVPFPDVIGLEKCVCETAECTLCHQTERGCVKFDPSTVNVYQRQCRVGSEMKTCTISGNEVIEQYSQNAISGGEMEVILEDSPCPGGLCDADGVCQRQSTDIVARFWDFLTHLNPNAVVQFMESNIVGTVAVFSFILWLPFAILVYCYDKKQAKKAALEDQAFRSISVRRRKPRE